MARVTGSLLRNPQAAAIEKWCQQRGIRCLYFLGDADDYETVQAAQENGFIPVDVRVELARRLQSESPDRHPAFAGHLRHVADGDVATLRQLARVSHLSTRFYFDWSFPRGRCDDLYERWLIRAVDDPNGQVWVAEFGESLAGYVTCHAENDEVGRIGLIAVSSTAQRQGVGQALVEGALQWFSGRGMREVKIVTQARNVAAQRLYERAGFQVQQVNLWYHRWFPRRPLRMPVP